MFVSSVLSLIGFVVAFYDKYSSVLMPYTSKERFMRANRYRRLFTGDVIRSGDKIIIPKKLV
jgi:hypothetical protein